jgi:hypothetical protein
MAKSIMDAPGDLMDYLSEALGGGGQAVSPGAYSPVQPTFPSSMFPTGAGTFTSTLPIMESFAPMGTLGSATPVATAAELSPYLLGGKAEALSALQVAPGATIGIGGALSTSAAATAYGGGMFVAPTALPGATGFAAMGAMGPLAVAAAAYMLMQAKKQPFDPTAETRRLNQYENIMQGDGAGIAGLEQLVYTTPDALQLIKDATSGGGRAEPFGTPHTSGGTKKISWSPNVSKKVQENMHLLEAASHAGQVASSGGPNDPAKPKKYAEVKSRATFNSGNDPYGHREREAALEKQEGIGNYIPSGRNLAAMKKAQYNIDPSQPGGGGGP